MYISIQISNPNPGVDYINAVCPCAGLSTLNTSKARGSDNAQNEWMIKSAEYVFGKIKPKVLWGENAPALFSDKGLGMVDKLRLVSTLSSLY